MIHKSSSADGDVRWVSGLPEIYSTGLDYRCSGTAIRKAVAARSARPVHPYTRRLRRQQLDARRSTNRRRPLPKRPHHPASCCLPLPHSASAERRHTRPDADLARRITSTTRLPTASSTSSHPPAKSLPRGCTRHGQPAGAHRRPSPMTALDRMDLVCETGLHVQPYRSSPSAVAQNIVVVRYAHRHRRSRDVARLRSFLDIVAYSTAHGAGGEFAVFGRHTGGPSTRAPRRDPAI